MGINIMNKDDTETVEVTPPVPQEVLDRFTKNRWKIDRRNNYPSIADQLDMIYHAGLGGDEFQATIKAVKDAHPKPTGE